MPMLRVLRRFWFTGIEHWAGNSYCLCARFDRSGVRALSLSWVVVKYFDSVGREIH